MQTVINPDHCQVLLHKFMAENAVLISDGHFVLKSGNHSSNYFDEWAIYDSPDVLMEISRRMIEFIHRLSGFDEVDCIVSTNKGGIILSESIGKCVGLPVVAISDIQKITEMNCLVLDDIVVSGQTIKRAIRSLKKAGNQLSGVVVLVNFGVARAEDIGNIPFLASLIRLKWTSWHPQECPKCLHKIPISKEYGWGGRDFKP